MLSSGMLSSEESLALLQRLRRSAMYRADQHSYILYPDRDLLGFLHKNRVSETQAAGSKLIAKLVKDGDRTLILKDEDGVYHFNGAFRNAKGVAQALADLGRKDVYADLVDQESALILDLFEETFQHSKFTGRSGTFFAFEGLGSIYWHMVSKLLLAAEECFVRAVEQGADQATIEALRAAYYDARRGLGFNKSPEEYGAFPTDPYSHTPAAQGAKQPGMTGLVKEEILTRLGELGVVVEHGALGFKPLMLRASEFIDVPGKFVYLDLMGETRSLDLPAGALAFTYCQVPVVYYAGDQEKIEVTFADGRVEDVAGTMLPVEISASLFKRDGRVARLVVHTSAGV
jgi:hypothetical protein